MNNYKLELEVTDEETGEKFVRVGAFSLESLEEQLHKVEKAIKAHSAKKHEETKSEEQNS